MNLDALEDAVEKLSDELMVEGWVESYSDGFVVTLVKVDGTRGRGLLLMTLKMQGLVRTENDWTTLRAKLVDIFEVTAPKNG